MTAQFAELDAHNRRINQDELALGRREPVGFFVRTRRFILDDRDADQGQFWWVPRASAQPRAKGARLLPFRNSSESSGNVPQRVKLCVRAP